MTHFICWLYIWVFYCPLCSFDPWCVYFFILYTLQLFCTIHHSTNGVVVILGHLLVVLLQQKATVSISSWCRGGRLFPSLPAAGPWNASGPLLAPYCPPGRGCWKGCLRSSRRWRRCCRCCAFWHFHSCICNTHINTTHTYTQHTYIHHVYAHKYADAQTHTQHMHAQTHCYVFFGALNWIRG